MERVYLVMHLCGVCLLFASLGALGLHVMNGGDKKTNSKRKLVMMSHGLSLTLIVVAGVGLLKLGYGRFADGWVHAKLGIWLFLGAAPALIYRVPGAAKMLWFILPLMGGLAFYFARFKLG